MKRITTKQYSIMLTAGIFFLLSACSVSQFVPGEGIIRENNYAVIRSDTLLIIVKPQSYPGSYQEINNRFFPVFISIKNNSTQKIKLQENSFSILCNEKQYDPVPVDYILADLERKMMLQEFSDPFLPPTEFGITDRTKEQEMYYELVNNAFSWGELLPGAKKDGYLFYNKEIASASCFTINILGFAIPFIK
ncbi:MAG TPA: hypothetical protein PKU76_04010, partial [Candidatus Cloacimonas sp.]|nr:hypothetical protein [Candidatus Cloacimonas sp.]